MITSSQHSMVGDTSKYTAEQDAYCVFFFFGQQVGEIQVLPLPSGLELEDLQDRFLEIMKYKNLQDRVLRYVKKGDIINFKKVKFSLIEDFAIFKAEIYSLPDIKTLDYDLFAPRFHLSRNFEKLLSRHFKLAKKGRGSYKAQLKAFLEYKKEFFETYQGETLVEINTSPEDLDPYVLEDQSQRYKPENYFKDIKTIIEYIQKNFTKRDFCALRGPGLPVYINRANVIIGRETQFNHVDIDLTSYGIKSVSRRQAHLKLCSDMNFYLTCLSRNMLVNGDFFMVNQVVQLKHGDVVDLSGYTFVFVENEILMNQLRRANQD